MSGDSDDEQEIVAVAPPDYSLLPFHVVLCFLCYIYGMWLGVYICPK
jgi:hypothetical protein